MHKKAQLVALALTLSLTGANAVHLTANTTIGPADTDFEDQPIIVDNCTLTVGGAHRFQSLQIMGSGRITTDISLSTAERWVNLTISGDVLVDADASIDVSAQGYESASGPGAGAGGGGGGHGGIGGTPVGGVAGGAAYDSLLSPTELGSGGGNGYNAAGGWGGAAIRLMVGGTLTLNGGLLANGGNGGGYLGGTAGGGGGGSIHATAGTLAGSGAIAANGGASTGDGGAGGAGGRIAILYTGSTFAGSVSAHGGSAAVYGSGGAGTVYTQQAGQVGFLAVDNSNALRSGLTPISAPEPLHATLANGALAYPGTALTLASLTVKSNAVLTTLPTLPGLDLTVHNNLLIEATGRVDVSGSGHALASGPGAGLNNGGGGGHGGEGGRVEATDTGGNAYDAFLTPSEFGSGGGNAYASAGGAGGGSIRLKVGQTLQVDGTLAANGADAVVGPSGGGGAGGALHLTVGSLTGQGVIAANGGSSIGNGYGYGGGGGGGRIAIYSATRAFSGSISAFPGTGQAQAGGAGTIYLQLNSQSVGDLNVDGNATASAFTPLTSPVACRVVVSNRASAYALAALNFSSLRLESNATLTHLPNQKNLALTVQGDLVVDATSVVTATGKGYGQSSGPGAATANLSGGGGHGGQGGTVNNPDTGGIANDNPSAPVWWGSGGGGGYNSSGGSGGGAIRLIVSGKLELNGALSADGQAGAGNAGGGGAGGSIWVSAVTLSGTGSVWARGGVSIAGGGGGGGCVVLAVDQRSTFSGAVTAAGGSGAASGQSGTLIETPLTIPQIHLALVAGSLQLSWPSVAGFGYQLESSSTLESSSFSREGEPLVGTGELLSRMVPMGPAPRKVFRLKVNN